MDFYEYLPAEFKNLVDGIGKTVIPVEKDKEESVEVAKTEKPKKIKNSKQLQKLE